MSSIRRNLLLALLGAMLLVLLLGAAATYRAEVQQAQVLLDYQLRQTALALRDQAFGAIASPALGSGEQDFDYSIQVWNEDGVSIYYSYPPHVFPNRAQLGFSNLQTPEGPWRVFAMQGRREIIQVAQPFTRRDQLAAHAALQSLRPFLLLFPLMGVVIWIVVGRGLAPIARLASVIGTRTPGAMQPVSEQVPEEIAPLVRALNQLLEKLNAALQAQRQLVADAAHELRTPLAALLLQTQLVERANSDEQRVAALAELKLGLERATRAMQQLLTLAREEPGPVRAAFAPVRLDQLLASVTRQFHAIAVDRHIALTFTNSALPMQVSGDESSLRTLFANLLDNALRYTPSQGTVSVSLQQAGGPMGHAIVRVEDSGPGIPAAERQRVFDRFYRRPDSDPPGTGHPGHPGHPGYPGTGLGLAIVQAIAERHALKVTLGDAQAGGLLVSIAFPLGL